MLSKASELAVGFKNRLVIGLWGSIDKDLLLPIFRKYAETYRDDRLSFKRYSVYNALYTDLANNLIDIAFTPHYCIEEDQLSDNYQKLSIGTIEAYAAVPPGNQLSKHKSICAQQLSDQNIIVVNRMEPFYRKELRKAGISPVSIEAVSDIDALLFHVSAGNGIALVTPNLTNYYSGELSLLKFDDNFADFQIIMMCLKNHRSPATVRFVKTVEKFITAYNKTS